MNSTTKTETIDDYIGQYGGYVFHHLSQNGLGPREGSVATPSLQGAFGCCGAQALTGCSGTYLTSRELREEFVLKLFGTMPTCTIYFLPTTSQMKLHRNNPNSVLHLLFELGAKEVHVSPNRIHGPNNLHLCVLDRGDPEIRKMVKEKYLAQERVKDRYGYQHERLLPRFVAEKFGIIKVKEEPVAVAAAVVVKKATPVRDAFGRFARKV